MYQYKYTFQSYKRLLYLFIISTSLLFLVVFSVAPVFAEPKENNLNDENTKWFQKFFWSFRTEPDEPRGAEDYRAETHTVRIPEPMVFDLVRGLGAKQGEVEVNVLGIFPTKNSDLRGIQWAPEIEAAIFDGIALEFELPFERSHLEAYKFAGQVTFGTAFQNHFIHGSQIIVEKINGKIIWETSLLYIPGVRLNEVFSMLAMIGFRNASGSDIDNDTELIVNYSAFADLGSVSSLGVELNYASGLNGEDGAFRLMPQAHIEIIDHLMLQVGVGALFIGDNTFPEVASRLIYTF